MKLYWFRVAPNPTKVRLYIAEKNARGAGIALEEIVVKLPKGEQRSPGFLLKNPFGGVPVLELDDGTTVIESLPIIDYLEELHPEPPIWGRDAITRARARELERIAEMRLLMPVAHYIHATKSPTGLPPNPGVAERSKAAWPAALAYLDALFADERPFINGEFPGVVDCTVQSAFQFARFAKLDFDLEESYSNLARWDQNYRARDASAGVLSL